jgi:hypothetical protein
MDQWNLLHHPLSYLCSGLKSKWRTSSWKDVASTTKFIRSESQLCTKCVLIALQYLTLLASTENTNKVAQEENSDSGGHRERKWKVFEMCHSELAWWFHLWGCKYFQKTGNKKSTVIHLMMWKTNLPSGGCKEDAPDRRESYLKEAEDEEERKNVKSGTCLV